MDLDGTLIKTDMLYESVWAALTKNVRLALAELLGLLFKGRATIKRGLADFVIPDPALLPYNRCVIEFVQRWREHGGRTALVTATDQRVADEVAAHLGLFDEVHGSDGRRNLKGRAKAVFLVDRYGVGGYDYIGDSRADLPVWADADRALTVNAGTRVKRQVERRGGRYEHLAEAAGEASAAIYLKALRPHQWIKNLLVFVPMLSAHASSLDMLIPSLLAFVAFSLVASGVYVINDLLDLAADRAHPRKRRRPFACGAIPILHGSLMAPALLAAGMLCGLFVGRAEFLMVLAGYVVLTTAYSMSLKRKLIIDICTLAGLYTIRIIAGGVATGLTLSVWLLAFSIFFFLSLAAVKRQVELVDGLGSGRREISGRAYRPDDLPIVAMMAMAAGYVGVLVVALYVNSDAVVDSYERPELLWGVCPVLLFWISRMIMLAHRGAVDDDPIVFAAKDRISQLCGVLVVGLVVAGAWP